MRRCPVTFALVCLLALVVVASADAADETKAKPVGPAKAAKMVDNKVILEMEVKSTGKSQGAIFLNSEDDYKSAKNFTIFINQAGVKKFQEAKVEDPVGRFKGKTIRITGTVKLYRDKPEIVVEDPKQIVVVEKK